jgi:hypothetical protein
MLAVSRTHYLPPRRLAGPFSPSARVRDTGGAGGRSRRVRSDDPSGDPPAALALLAHLAGLALGTALIIGTTTLVALGLSLALR